MTTFLRNYKFPNTGWKYYKQYYDMNVGTTIQDINNSIFNTVILEIPALINDPDLKFDAVTTYPGLVIGTGYTHEKKDDDHAFKIGFFFDYTSGMPIIPGSSVKGVLRSAFPQRIIVPKKVVTNQLEKENWIKEILEQKCGITGDVDIDELEREIFDGLRKEPYQQNKARVAIQPVPVYERDIFFDAVPIEITANNIGHSKQLLGSDYITPHKNKDRNLPELDPFSNPNPLKFLKIMPSVKIEFRFKLEDSVIIPALNLKNKIILFREIITTLGIGAKTNVGYGQFETLINE